MAIAIFESGHDEWLDLARGWRPNDLHRVKPIAHLHNEEGAQLVGALLVYETAC